jgi:hypothetical protein
MYLQAKANFFASHLLYYRKEEFGQCRLPWSLAKVGALKVGWHTLNGLHDFLKKYSINVLVQIHCLQQKRGISKIMSEYRELDPHQH